MSARLLTAVLLWLAGAAASAGIRDEVAAHYARHLGDLFEWFHRNPELSFLEHDTAARLAAELRALGVEVTEGVGGTGVVGMLRNGAGPLVLLRADMDGLPVREQSGLPYASTRTQANRDGEEVPVMHACGHDVHMTALVGAARLLTGHRDSWRGTVMLVGQPAEERIGGARAMLEDGLYERFGVPDVALAFHVGAGLEAGAVGVRPGLSSSSSDSVDITVRGVGAHGASPHQGKDPVYIAAQLVIALQGIVSRELSPHEPGVITVGSIHGGSKHNIIGNEVQLQLTVRADSEATRAKLLAGIRRVAEHVGRLNGLPDSLLPVVRMDFESTPVVINDALASARVMAAFNRHFSEERLVQRPRTGMGAEDFAYFIQTEHQVPGVYFGVGGTPPAELRAAQDGGPPIASHHSPGFRIDPRPAVTAGAEGLYVAALEFLAKP